MVKYIICFFLIHSCLCFAQRIEIDRVEDDGRRQLMSSSLDVSLDGSVYHFIVKAYERYGDIDWYLLVSSFNHIPENATLLIKLGNDENLEIPINNHYKSVIDKPTYSYVIGNIVYNTNSTSADYYRAIFDLTDSQYAKIEEYGITKIRISSHKSYNEKVWKKDKLGKFITKCRKIMFERFTTTRVKSIHDDF